MSGIGSGFSCGVGGVVGVSGRSASVEGGRVGHVQLGAGTEPLNQVRVGERESAYGDQVRRAVVDVLGAGGQIGAAAVEDERSRPLRAQGVQQIIVARVHHVQVGQAQRAQRVQERRVQLGGV